VAGHSPDAGRCPGRSRPVGVRAAEERSGPTRDGQELLGDDLSERRQHHAHARVRQPDRARHPRRGPAAYAARPGRTGLAPAHARDRRGHRRQRQGRHAHEPGLRRRRLRRRALRHRPRPAPRDLHRARRRAGRDRALPQDRRAASESVPVAAVEPLRRAGRADVARGRVHPLGARVPDGCEPRAHGLVALLASALLLALEGRVHPGPGARLRARHGPGRARADDRIPHRSGRGRPRPPPRAIASRIGVTSLPAPSRSRRRASAWPSF